jgi:SAM-dependent methyltransferase
MLTRRTEQGEINKQRSLTSDLFDNSWFELGGFSLGVEENSTPLLDAFIKSFEDRKENKSSTKNNNRIYSITEAGCGGGLHTLEIAKKLNKKAHIIAVDTSEKAQKILKENIAQNKMFMRIKAVKDDIYEIVAMAKHVEKKFDGFYANSVLHFFHPADRYFLLHTLHEIMDEKGVIAISYKKKGDALEREGDIIKNIPGGTLVKGKDNIIRLFVEDPDPFICELKGAGFKIEEKNIFEWSIMGYNKKNEKGEFVGFLAQRNGI